MLFFMLQLAFSFFYVFCIFCFLELCISCVFCFLELSIILKKGVDLIVGEEPDLFLGFVGGGVLFGITLLADLLLFQLD